MNSSQFDTSLCPYRLGIISRVRQVLLPHVTAPGAGNAESGSVVAELYKLNVSVRRRNHIKAGISSRRSAKKPAPIDLRGPVRLLQGAR